MTNYITRRLDKFEKEVKPMIENEILYHYDNLSLAQDSANVLNEVIESFLTESTQQAEQAGYERGKNMKGSNFREGYETGRKEAEQELMKRVREWATERRSKCVKLKTSKFVSESEDYFRGKIAIIDDLLSSLEEINNKE